MNKPNKNTNLIFIEPLEGEVTKTIKINGTRYYTYDSLADFMREAIANAEYKKPNHIFDPGEIDDSLQT